MVIDECDKEVDLVIDMMMPISHEIQQLKIRKHGMSEEQRAEVDRIKAEILKKKEEKKKQEEKIAEAKKMKRIHMEEIERLRALRSLYAKGGFSFGKAGASFEGSVHSGSAS